MLEVFSCFLQGLEGLLEVLSRCFKVFFKAKGGVWRLSGSLKGSEEVGVSLYQLVMRVVGLEDEDLAALRRQVYSHYASLEACFQAEAALELNLEQPLS